jgi:hypothetical protein
VVEAYHIGVPHSPSEIRELVTGFDTVITQIGPNSPETELSVEGLTNAVGQVLHLPIFQFTGLHPDMMYAMKGQELFKGASSDMHSRIAISGYLIGLDERKIERLFNAHIFSELGYFDAFPAAHELLLKFGNEAGYDFGSKFDSWMATGKSFMHTVNHPTMAVLSELSRDALARAGHIAAETLAPDDVRDDLANSLVAPILPPLARRLKLEGGTTYLRPASHGPDREITLKEYIAESLDIYRSTDMTDVHFTRQSETLDTLERAMAG